jgi:hypothetical protein
MAKATQQQPQPPITLTVDLVAILDRLAKAEAKLALLDARLFERLDEIESTAQSNYDSLIEYVPTIKGDKLVSKVFTDKCETVEVEVEFMTLPPSA